MKLQKALWKWILESKVGDAIFGNKEDGYYGDSGFNPTGSTSTLTAIKWWLKNPFHNFTWHVIGVVGKAFTRTGKYPKDVFAPIEGWNFALILVSGWFPLPFISYWSASLGKFYIGWRERGAFGIKLTGKLLVTTALIAAATAFILYTKDVSAGEVSSELQAKDKLLDAGITVGSIFKNGDCFSFVSDHGQFGTICGDKIFLVTEQK